MPTRSINLKLVVPRRPDQLGQAQALWSTHQAVNRAVHHYENLLLLLRGEAFETRETKVPRDTVRADLLAAVRAAQHRNGAGPLLSDDEVVSACGALYKAIVPAAVGRQGTAQAANAFLGPLTDPKSKGFLDIFEKLERPIPDWLGGVEADEPAAINAAQAWLTSPAAQPWVTDTGRPPRWLRLARKGDAGWPRAFAVKWRELEKDGAEGVPALIQRLKQAGILPITEPYLANRITNARGAVSPWDRLALRLAVSHLLSWESWCRRSAEAYEARRGRVTAFKKGIDTGLAACIKQLRGYEAGRKRELEAVALPMGEREFRITLRMVRGWDELREKWRKPTASPEALGEIMAAAQTKNRGRFGDPHLFSWLARPENHGVWKAGEGDAVSVLARLNAMEAILERSRETAIMTLPDPVEHPRPVQWEAEGGTNLRSYALLRAPDGLKVKLPLLTAAEGGAVKEESFAFEIAPSEQFDIVDLQRDGKNLRVRYRSGGGEVLTGLLGSADLLLRSESLRNRNVAELAAGRIGPAYLKLSLDLDQIVPEDAEQEIAKGADFFLSARGQRRTPAETVRPGLRVLSVDLGVRCFATCSVYELKDARPASGKSAFGTAPGLWAVHERSFTLDLPGEQRGAASKWRAEREDELRRLRRALGRHRRLLWMTGVPEGERPAQIADFRAALDTGDPWPFERPLLDELEAKAGSPQPVWDGLVRTCSAAFRTEFGLIVADWRKRTKVRDAAKQAGKSMWSLQHLMEVRRFLQSWSLAGRASGDIRRLDREQGGVFARRLLDHINNLKEDRLKTGADLIVQAARGLRRDATGAWVPAYRPCHVVLFEDLSRYRMRTDRPRRENSMLMKWAHRSVPQEVAMQGELYGLLDRRQGRGGSRPRGFALFGFCMETGAAFSSRYHADTMTPGVRCHALRGEDFDNPAFRDLLQRETPSLAFEDLHPGDLVPLQGGEQFVCLAPSGGLVRVHADINAAHNLQRRFWTQHGDAFRLPTGRVEVSGALNWVPRALGKRLLGALGGHGCLQPTGHESGSCRWRPLSAAAWRRLAGESPDPADDAPGKEEDQELTGLAEEALERSGERVVFFRDPSGVVLPPHLWYPAATFWGIVRQRTVGRLLAR